LHSETKLLVLTISYEEVYKKYRFISIPILIGNINFTFCIDLINITTYLTIYYLRYKPSLAIVPLNTWANENASRRWLDAHEKLPQIISLRLCVCVSFVEVWKYCISYSVSGVSSGDLPLFDTLCDSDHYG
jgi:hypothetical protein